MSRTLLTLPQELLLEMIKCLTKADIARLVLTCKYLAQIASPGLYDIGIFEAMSRARTPLAARMSLTYKKIRKSIKKWQSEFTLRHFRAKKDSLLTLRDWQGRSLLHLLAGAGNTRLLASLLTDCINISVTDNKGETPLHAAIKKGKEATTLQLLEAGADITPTTGKCILAYVSNGTSRLALQKLINAIQAAGGSISKPGPDGQTPLHHASLRGNEQLVDVLIANDADILTTNQFGHPPLICAVLGGQLSVSKVLLNIMKSHGYDINVPIASLRDIPAPWVPQTASIFYEDGDTLLHSAVGTWNTSIVQLLLEAGANPIAENRCIDRPARTPFDIAVRGRAPEMVATIVGMKSPPDFWHSNGYIQEGFETCVREAYPGTVRLLLDLMKAGKINLDVNNPDDSGMLPMLAACTYYGDHRSDQDINDTITYVVTAGAHVDAMSPDGQTALHLLCEDSDETHDKAKMKLIEFLLDFGADWRLQDREGNTVLHKAAGRGFEGIVEHILTLPSFTEERAILTRVNKHGNTALHLAAKAPYTTDVATLSTVKSLLDAGFSPNAVNYDGQSLAHLLVRDGLFDDAMKMLSKAGVNMSLKDSEGRPPVHYITTVNCDKADRVMMYKYFVQIGAGLHDGCEQCATLNAKLQTKYHKQA